MRGAGRAFRAASVQPEASRQPVYGVPLTERLLYSISATMISSSPSRSTAEAARPRSAEAGFTILELLVVVIVLGIFVTIVVPRFASSRERAYDAAAKSELRNAMSAQEAYFTDAQAYTTEVGASGLDLTSLPAVTVTIPSAGASGYMMTAKHGSSSNTYCIDSDVGEIVPGTTC